MTPSLFILHSTLLNVTNGGRTISSIVHVGDTIETTLSTLGIPILAYEYDIITEFLYPDLTILFDNSTKRIVSIDQTINDDLLVGEVVDSIGEPNGIGFDEERQEPYLFYTTGLQGEYGLFFYFEEDVNENVWVTSVEIALMVE